MSLKDLIVNDRPISVSFEFSPPKTDEAEAALWATIQRLAPEPGSDGKIAVSLWLAHDPRLVIAGRREVA